MQCWRTTNPLSQVVLNLSTRLPFSLRSVSSRRDNRKLAGHKVAGLPFVDLSRPERTMEHSARSIPSSLQDVNYNLFSPATS